MVDIFDGAFKIKDSAGRVAAVDEYGRIKMALSYDLDGITTISGSLQTQLDEKMATLAADTSPQLGGDLHGNGHAMIASNHGNGNSHQVVNVVYSSSTLPTASGVTEGTIGIVYTA